MFVKISEQPSLYNDLEKKSVREILEDINTEDKIYMVETKASNEMNSSSVKEKAAAAVVYCRAVSEWNADNGGKPWEYALISHDEVRLNSSFKYLVSNRASYKQMGIEDLVE